MNPARPHAPKELREAAAQLRAASGADGIASFTHELSGALPGSSVGNVAYDLALGLGLWFSDLADFTDETADYLERAQIDGGASWPTALAAQSNPARQSRGPGEARQ